MKTFLILMMAVCLSGCLPEEARHREHQRLASEFASELQYWADRLDYVQASDTKLCFVSNWVSHARVLTNVPCTPEVLAEIQAQAPR